ncbi:hypothetical protein FRC02_009921 [Tulasnella sp. 418]|nr:hypothetical protein FRC02_009921 [Tulasnella sp. 418]
MTTKKATLLIQIYISLAKAATYPVLSGHSHISQQATSLSWGPCITAQEWLRSLPNPPWSTPICANFTVPLDWTNTSDPRTATLYVQKIPSRNSAAVGTIFTNPGGPGSSGAAFLNSVSAVTLFNIIGGDFDIISWDPRGVGLSKPSINCFQHTKDTSFAQASLDQYTSLIQNTLQARSAGPGQADIEQFINSGTHIKASFNSVVETCIKNNGEELKYVGTVATVKDLVSLADAIEGQGKPIHYWGFSYGTVLGATLMDLYPSRVGRIVLDGVLDAGGYYQKEPYKAYIENIQDANSALQAFYDACAAAGPSRCPMASTGSTGQTIQQWANELIDAAYADTQVTNSDLVRTYLAGAARSPTSWGGFSEQLFTLNLSLRRDSSLFGTQKDLTKRRLPDEFYATIRSATYAIWCGDSGNNTNTTTKDVLNEVVRLTREVSNVYGPLALSEVPTFFCHLWPVRAVERHQPSFPAPKLANPVLVIGNTFDVITPLAAARKLVNRLNVGKRQAALIQHNASGHTTLETYSACTRAIIRDYFTDGTLPEDTLCEVNFNGSFSNCGSRNVPSTSIISAPLASAWSNRNNAFQRHSLHIWWMTTTIIANGVALMANM